MHPIFNLYNHEWPIYTALPSQLPPAKFVFEDAGPHRSRHRLLRQRRGHRLAGARSGGRSSRPGVIVESGALVEDSVLMNDVTSGRMRSCAGPSSTRTSIVERAVRVRHATRARRQPLHDFGSRGRRRRQGWRGPSYVKVALLTKEYPPEVYGGRASTSST